MSNIVNFNEFKTSENMPITEEDFDNLDNYKISTLFRVLKTDKKHQNKILNNLFIRLKKDEEIEYFKNFLIKNDIYNYYFSSIAQSNNDVYKIHLALYYDNNYIKSLFKDTNNLAKQIYKYGKNYRLNSNTFEYLIKLSSLDCDYKTQSTIKKIVIKLFKKEIIDLQLYRIKEMIYGNYFLMIDNHYIKETQSDKMTKILKKVNKNYEMDKED